MIVVGVRFKPAGKIYYFAPATIELKLDDGVIVETARGMEFGHVVIAPRSVDSSEVVQPLKPIIRKATAKDFRQVEKNKEREKKAFGICLAKIAKHKLPMTRIDVDYTCDMGKIIFFFTADGRIDFRLMCCLRYENQRYTSGELKCCNCQQQNSEQQKPPAVGKRVMTDEGVGTVLRVHMKDHTVKVQLESGHNINVPWSDVGETEHEH